jgi:serralysin
MIHRYTFCAGGSLKLMRVLFAGLVVGLLFPVAVLAADTDNDGVSDDIDSQPLVANPVQLDALFANGGTAIPYVGDFDDSPLAMVLQADGKPVLAGVVGDAKGKYHIALVRYNPDGSLDSSFDGDGKLTPVFGKGQAYATAIAQQPDGKLVVAGMKKSGAVVASLLLRYLPDGSLDTSFGKKGVVTHTIGRASLASSLVLLPDGRLAVAGFTLVGSITKMYVASYKANGSRDRSFGNNGVRVVGIGGRDTYANSLLRQSDGKLVVAGSAPVKYGDHNRIVSFALLRLNEDGSKDKSFGIDGVVTTNASAMQLHTISKITQQQDGKLVAAVGAVSGSSFGIVRYDVDGSLDTSFGNAGIQSTQFDSGWPSGAASVLVLPDGRLVVAGYAWIHLSTGGANCSMALVFYKQDGSLDTAVNGSGKVIIPSSYRYSEAVSMAQQPDGR